MRRPNLSYRQAKSRKSIKNRLRMALPEQAGPAGPISRGLIRERQQRLQRMLQARQGSPPRSDQRHRHGCKAGQPPASCGCRHRPDARDAARRRPRPSTARASATGRRHPLPDAQTLARFPAVRPAGVRHLIAAPDKISGGGACSPAASGAGSQHQHPYALVWPDSAGPVMLCLTKPSRH